MHAPLTLLPLNFFRTRLFAAIVALLVLGGFSHDVWGRIVDHDHEMTAPAHSNGEPASEGDQGAGHHATSHSHALTVVFNDEPCFHGGVLCGLIRVREDSPPDAVPRGIDVPPQLA